MAAFKSGQAVAGKGTEFVTSAPRAPMRISITQGSVSHTTAPSPASTGGCAAPGCSAGCRWQSAMSCPYQGPLPNSSWPCHVLAQRLRFMWLSQ